MGIAEILAARKNAVIEKPAIRKEESIFAEDILEDEIDYKVPHDARFLNNYKVDPLFLACMKPLIRSPYQLYGIHAEYYHWLLLRDDNNVHVLNTFPPISGVTLLNAYMEYNPPRVPGHLHSLYCTISRLQLNMPPVYLPAILEIIRKESIKPLDNPEFFGYTDTSIFGNPR